MHEITVIYDYLFWQRAEKVSFLPTYFPRMAIQGLWLSGSDYVVDVSGGNNKYIHAVLLSRSVAMQVSPSVTSGVYLASAAILCSYSTFQSIYNTVLSYKSPKQLPKPCH